jgi:ferritin-like metal-binding protein YciE
MNPPMEFASRANENHPSQFPRESGRKTMNALTELFLEELADIYYAEKLLLKALPKMAKAARAESLKDAFAEHLSQTEQQVQRIEEVFGLFDKPAKSKKCEAMEGLVAEGKTIMAEWKGSHACDAALIAAAQKIEHYEIASYGCLCTWAKLLENDEALELLKETMNEEETTDDNLSKLAQDYINEEADQDDEGDMPKTPPKKPAAKKAVKRR